ncbi:MAG: hypothetical protein K6F03_10430 [Saccharofermentans sp.]|nr:hypothetical protein [Saccharofermentans sp.]
MKYSLKYDKKNGQLLDLELVPEKCENPDELFKYAQFLRIENIASEFNRVVKSGTLNECSDEQYAQDIYDIKQLSKTIFAEQQSQNIFMLIVALSKRVLGLMPVNQTMSGSTTTLQKFLDENCIYGDRRRDFYRFIAGGCLAPRLHNDGVYCEVNCEEMPMKPVIPVENHTYFIFRGDRVIAVASFDPIESWLHSNSTGEDDELFVLDTKPLLDDDDLKLSEDDKAALHNTVVLQKGSIMTPPELCMDLFKDKVIELYIYDDTPGEEGMTFRGHLDIKGTAKAENGQEALVFTLRKSGSKYFR